MGFKQHISRTWQMIEQQVNDVPFRPDDEAARYAEEGRSEERSCSGRSQEGRSHRLLQGRDRAAVQGLRGLRDVLQVRLPRREGQVLRSGQKVQKTPEIRTG